MNWNIADPTQGLNFYIHSVFIVKFKQACVAVAMVLDSSDTERLLQQRKKARGDGQLLASPGERETEGRDLCTGGHHSGQWSRSSQSFRLRGTRAEQSHWMMRLALSFLITLAGGGRVTQPECLRTITIGITVKVSDLRSRLPKPARLGAQQDSEGRQYSEGLTGTNAVVGPSALRGDAATERCCLETCPYVLSTKRRVVM